MFELTIKTRENDASFENKYPRRLSECLDQVSELIKDIQAHPKVVSASVNCLVISIETNELNQDELNEFLIKCIQPYYANGYLKGETLKNI
jgi:hypothetical protein